MQLQLNFKQTSEETTSSSDAAAKVNKIEAETTETTTNLKCQQKQLVLLMLHKLQN